MYKATYWNNEGKYQGEYDQLYLLLVPDMDHANTKVGKLLRSISKVYHDIYNNGGCNFDVLRAELNRVNAWIRKYLPEKAEMQCKKLTDKSIRISAKMNEEVLDIIVDSIMEWILNKTEKETDSE